MSSPTFEEIVEPVTPIEKWFDDYKILLTDQVLETPSRLADLQDDNERRRWWRLIGEVEVAQARLDHLDDLAILCDPRFDPATQRQRLSEHAKDLASQLTSDTDNEQNDDDTLTQVERDKILAKISDTDAVRNLVSSE